MLHSVKRFLLIYFTLFILFVTNAAGQSDYKLPLVVNPSPQSQAFTRYGDYPMTDYTGLTDITVPIHTVTGKKLSLPITMSFHASGRSASEINGTLGMRWTLNCGGLVTRTMKGAPDEWDYLTPHNPSMAPNFDELYSSCPDGKISRTFGKPIYDSEFDIFNYSLPNGKRGHFILRNVNGNKEAMIIPMESLKIQLVKSVSENGLYERVDITDVDGTKYSFGKVDASTANAVEVTPEYDQQAGMLAGGITTAWYLTKITSSDGADEISLSYTTQSIYSYNATQSANVFDRIRNDNSNFWQAQNDYYAFYLNDLLYTYHFQQTDINPTSPGNPPIVPIVTGIQFHGGSVAFNYAYAGFWAPKMLTEMTINRGSVPYKKAKFSLSKHTGEPEIFYLDGMSFYGEDPNLANEKYNFSYYEGGALSPQDAAKCKDWWGFYSATNSQLLPLRTITVAPISMSGEPVEREVGFQLNRDSREDSKKLGMLKTITFPTGGETEFVYESNKYDYTPYYVPIQNPAILEGPGLRIKEVISKPGDGGKNIHKVYKYGMYEDGRGYINELLRPGSVSRASLEVAAGNAMHFWTWAIPNSVPQQYGSDNQTGYRTRDYFSDPYISFDLSGTNIKYDAVSEYLIENGVEKQKTQNRYTWGDNAEVSDFIINDHDYTIDHPRKFSNPENAWRTPVLRNKAIYKYDNGQFNIARNEWYNYTEYASYLDEAWDVPTYMHTNVVYTRPGSTPGSVNQEGWYSTAKDYHYGHCSVYGYGLRKYVTARQEISKSVIEEYTPNGVITTERNFHYNDDYSLESEELVNSKNELIKTSYTYPRNYPNVPVYQDMLKKNIRFPIIETKTTVNGTQTKKTVTNFYSPTANVFVPQSVENQTGSHPQEVIANFNRYDKLGHILEQQKANNVKEVYLWGYQSRYPVAKILNTTYDIASTYISQSVLDGATGNGDDATLRAHLNNLRNIPGALVETYTYKLFVGMTSSTDANGRTSYYEYDGFGRLIYLRDKDNNILKKFCYNYAGQPENCSYSGNSAKSGTFIKQGCDAGYAGTPVTYTVAANTYFGPNADALALDEVNAKGQAYANQHGSCVIARYNTEKSGVFTKNNCAPRGIGSAITYTVAANTYAAYSEDAANQLAQNDVNTKGQNYANTHGYCTWYNIEKSGDFTKNDCPAGKTGVTITYTVNANTYSSITSAEHADQLAQNDVNEKGQEYANNLGWCEDHNAHLLFNNSSGHDVDIWLYREGTDEWFYLNVGFNQSDVALTVPSGNYEIAFWVNDSGSSSHFYSVGCDYWGIGSGPYNFYGVYLGVGTNCNAISIQ